MSRMLARPGRTTVEVGDADECGALLRNPVKGTAFRRYSLKKVGASQGNPCPQPVAINPDTRRNEWVLAEVRAWDAKRRGPGDHGGRGYGYRADAIARGDAAIAHVIDEAAS